MDAIGYRAARPDDADRIGALHVASWRETYAGLLPDHLLEGLSAAGRAAMWRVVLEDPAAHNGTALFVAESGDAIVGFGACGGQRDDALKGQGFDGEIGAVYVLRSHQGAGVGKMLMRMMARTLLAGGRQAASLWVLRENIGARTFYERLGGTAVGEKTGEHSGTMRTELAYGWRDLGRLSG